MVTPTCPKCKNAIAGEDINVAKDVAFCRVCNVSYQLSELTQGSELTADLDLHHPPPGAWCRSDGAGTLVGATHRSFGAALGMLAMALFWNGIVWCSCWSPFRERSTTFTSACPNGFRHRR